jgi:predicted RND superfamily exporter protein
MSCQYIAFALGHKFSNIHSLLPFLLLGIGVDDMFVVCNAVDQTDINDSAVKRMRVAMSHAGPSITITSFTNAVAFFFGSASSMIAL